MIKQQIIIPNKYGLHTRAAAKLVNLAKKFRSSIELQRPQQVIDCKSIMALITLGAKKGASFDLVISGEDEQAAMAAILGLIEGCFGEEE